MTDLEHIKRLIYELDEARNKLRLAKENVIELIAALNKARRNQAGRERNLSRDLQIYADHLSGTSYEDLAQAFSLSVGRIKDICSLQQTRLYREFAK